MKVAATKQLSNDTAAAYCHPICLFQETTSSTIHYDKFATSLAGQKKILPISDMTWGLPLLLPSQRSGLGKLGLVPFNIDQFKLLIQNMPRGAENVEGIWMPSDLWTLVSLTFILNLPRDCSHGLGQQSSLEEDALLIFTRSFKLIMRCQIKCLLDLLSICRTA